MAHARDGRFTQIADATDPVPVLTPCHTPPAGRRSRRLVVVSRLHSSKPSLESASTMSSGSAPHPRSASIQVIRPCSRSSLRPCMGCIVFSPSIVGAPKGESEVTPWRRDRKSTRLNSSHRTISYAVFCLKKKKEKKARATYKKGKSRTKQAPVAASRPRNYLSMVLAHIESTRKVYDQTSSRVAHHSANHE